MKILAIEKENKNNNCSYSDKLLKDEAESVYTHYLESTIEQIYFNDDNCAVIILNCKSVEDAKSMLSDMPLVKAGLIYFEITELRPYSGLSRLMDI